MAEMKMHEQDDGDLWTGRVLQERCIVRQVEFLRKN